MKIYFDLTALREELYIIVVSVTWVETHFVSETERTIDEKRGNPHRSHTTKSTVMMSHQKKTTWWKLPYTGNTRVLSLKITAFLDVVFFPTPSRIHTKLETNGSFIYEKVRLKF